MIVNLNEVLGKAQKGGYAVGLFNTTDTDMLQAAIEAAEEMHSPIIIGTAEVLLPYGEFELIAPSIVHMAEQASVPVVVHYDHGLTFDRCMQALRLGFSSIMFDGSLSSPQQNIAETREIVKIAHSFGASVEGEIGHVGNADESGQADHADAVNESGCADREESAEEDPYTTPKEAYEYVAATGVDALAVAVGTAHGVYIKKPKLDFDRLRSIRETVDTPLVLHGGSGLSDDDFRQAVKNGIAKINIYTDLCMAGRKAMEEGISLGENYNQIRNRKVAAIREVVKNKMILFGSVDKA